MPQTCPPPAQRRLDIFGSCLGRCRSEHSIEWNGWLAAACCVVEADTLHRVPFHLNKLIRSMSTERESLARPRNQQAPCLGCSWHVASLLHKQHQAERPQTKSACGPPVSKCRPSTQTLVFDRRSTLSILGNSSALALSQFGLVSVTVQRRCLGPVLCLCRWFGGVLVMLWWLFSVTIWSCLGHGLVVSRSRFVCRGCVACLAVYLSYFGDGLCHGLVVRWPCFGGVSLIVWTERPRHWDTPRPQPAPSTQTAVEERFGFSQIQASMLWLFGSRVLETIIFIRSSQTNPKVKGKQRPVPRNDSVGKSLPSKAPCWSTVEDHRHAMFKVADTDFRHHQTGLFGTKRIRNTSQKRLRQDLVAQHARMGIGRQGAFQP